MIRNTEEFLAALRAARRASTPLVSIRTADPASAIALTTRSLNGDADGTSLLSWDIMTGLSALNGPGKKMLDSIIGERSSEAVGPADALSLAARLGDDAVMFYANPQRLWHDPMVVQGLWNLRDTLKAVGAVLMLITPAGSVVPQELTQDVLVIDEPLPSHDDLGAIVRTTFENAKLTDHQRRTLIGQWSAVRNVYEEYAEQLTAEQLEKMSRFFIKPLTDRRKLARHTPWAGVHREQQERVKNKSDAVQQQFYRVRYVAGVRCNQVRRLYLAVTEAIAFVEKNHRSYPHEFNYEESVQTPGGRSVRQRVELTLWDAVSVREHAIGLGYSEAPETTRQRRWRDGRYSEARVPHYVEYNATVSLERKHAAEPFWFLELFRHRVFRRVEARSDSDLADKRDEFDRKWGYQSCVSWSDDGMLSLGSADYRPLDYVHAQEGHEFLPYEGIYAAALFGGLMVRMGTITGARGGEIQQIAQSPDCFKQLDNVGPKAATRWVLRMVPKGRKDRTDYYIDEDTKNHLAELIRFQCERLGTTLLPVVNSEYGKTPPDRYVLQWNGHGIDLQVLNTLIRFLLHGVVFQAIDGTIVQLTSHLLRHAFANEMAELKVSVDIIASLLHQRDKTVTKYYSRPTPTQVIRAAEMIFVDRIDVGAEALRSPNEIGRMLKEAEGKLGALTEVFGGTCVVANMCPAKFACVGCAGNAPDPAKRYQIQQKLAWATEQVGYAAREHLPGEEAKLGQLIADCKLVMEEMDLIEVARADRSQDVAVHHGHNSR
jgi:hypothetical protein